MQRRAQNAREAEERCRRLKEAVEIVTDYRRHLDGKATNGRPPKRSEVKAVYANIKEDIQAVLGRVDRETRRMVDNEYVHEPQSYRPKRRVSHTDSCTCECCYLEDERKKEKVKKDLSQTLVEMICLPERMSGDAEDFQMDLENAEEYDFPQKDNRTAPIDIKGPGRKSVTWLDDSTEDDEEGQQSEGCNPAAGPEMAIQTDDVFCQQCNSFTGINYVGRAAKVKLEMKDVTCQTEKDLFSCPCCSHHLN